MEISIRKATVEDVPAFRELRLEALHENPTAFSADYAVNLTYPAEYWNNRLKDLDDQTNMIYFAAAGQRLAGMCGILRGSSPKTMHSALIWGVYVRPIYRGQQVGEGMIEAGLRWAGERGVRVVKLGVGAHNLPAIRCYARCGFQVYGVEPLAIQYGGVDYDELLMSVRVPA